MVITNLFGEKVPRVAKLPGLLQRSKQRYRTRPMSQLAE